MQPEVGETVPASRQSATLSAGWIRGDPGDLMPHQQLLRRAAEPRRMPRLAGNRAVVAIAKSAEEPAGCWRVERQRGRQLHQYRAALASQAGGLLEKLPQQSAGADETPF